VGTLSRIWIHPFQKFLSALERSLLGWNQPLPAMILAGLIYLGISSTAGAPWRLSTAPYYNLLADAFLHGQLHLRVIPADTIDLSLFQGHYYLYWGPLPAVLAIPLVALFGIQVSDVLQTLFFSAVNVGMLALVLKAAVERGVIHLKPVQRAILVLFFALGTAYTPITGSGHVWQMAQVESILFAFLAALATFKMEHGKAFFFTGCAMAGILLTRSSAVFIAIFLAWYLLQQHWGLGLRRLARYCGLGLLPVLLALLLTGLYNTLRFGSPLETGLSYHLMSAYFANDFYQYGVFNIRFIPQNIYYTYFFYPYSFNPLGVTVRCGSLFLLSPLFFCAIYGVWKYRKQAMPWVLLASILLANIPILLLMGSGSSLFGPRYTLDFILPLLLLTSLGMEGLPTAYASLLMIVSALQYLLGSLIYLQGVP
jgi:hypothetical protein